MVPKLNLSRKYDFEQAEADNLFETTMHMPTLILVRELEKKLKATLADLAEQHDEAKQLLLEICTSETSFRPRFTLEEGLLGAGAANPELTLCQQVAQGQVEVTKGGEVYQMREVLHWKRDKCGDHPKPFIVKQLEGKCDLFYCVAHSLGKAISFIVLLTRVWLPIPSICSTCKSQHKCAASIFKKHMHLKRRC